MNHARTRADVARYRIEPYVIAGDVYSHPDHRGRGGWSWYTGSAGWMYRAGIESILGLRRAGATFAVDPCIPVGVARVSDRLADGRHPLQHLRCRIPSGAARGVVEATLDGKNVDHLTIPLLNDGAVHQVGIVLGVASRRESRQSPARAKAAL